VTGANPRLITNFVEDQLPTWTADSNSIVLLSRREGGRQSQLIKTDSSTELGDSVVLGEGEYPSIGASGRLVFKGWGNTAYGLRIATSNMEDIETVTNADEDTAPALSPDGTQIAFMSRREGNWNIYVANANGSNLQRLTDDEADDGLPTWSPDGNAIAFVSNRGGPWAVWAMTPDGFGKRQLFTMEGSPDGFVGADTYASRGWAEERISWTKADLE
jgi:TolB protein